MSEKLKNLLVRCLFYLLDVRGGDTEEHDPQVISWLSRSSQDIGFVRYVQMRERAMVRSLLIDGNLPMPRDSFVRKSGQRFELHSLVNRAAKARKIEDEKIKARKEKTESKGNI